MCGKSVTPENEVAGEGKEEANNAMGEDQLNAHSFTWSRKDIFVCAILAKCSTAIMSGGFYLIFLPMFVPKLSDLYALPVSYGGLLTVIAGSGVLGFSSYFVDKSWNRYQKRFSINSVWGMIVSGSWSFTFLEIAILFHLKKMWIGAAIFFILAVFLDGWALRCLVTVSQDSIMWFFGNDLSIHGSWLRNRNLSVLV